MRENIENFKNFDIICLNETNCDPENLPNGTNDVKLDGFHKPYTKKPIRDSNRGGGLAIYVNMRVCEEENLEPILISPTPNQNNISIECLFLQIKLKLTNNCTKNFIIGNFYRSPSSKPAQSMEQLEEIFTKLHNSHKNKHVTLVGDFNIDLLKYERDINGQAMIDLTTSYGYCQVISRPTRITDHTATLIDHIYTNQVHNINKSGIVTYDISDHLATYVSIALFDRLNSKHLQEAQPHGGAKLIFNDENLAKFGELLQNDDWDEVHNEQDTQLKYDIFTAKYTKHYDTAFTIQNPTPRKKQRANPKPWILPWLEEACDRKNRLYAAYIAEPTERNKAIYSKMNKFVKKQIKLAKKKYYAIYFKKHNSNSRKQWQMINSLLNRAKPRQHSIHIHDNEGNITKNPRDVADKFNDYFTNIAERLKSENRINVDHKLFLTNPLENSIFIDPADRPC